MSVDVEDWFQVENLKSAIPRETWPERDYRVEANTDRILQIFADTGTSATFFCLGWVAERSPQLILRIAEAGHEVASHGFAHQLVYDQEPGDFAEDIRRARELLQDISGQAVVGYRAPSFSITTWGARELSIAGYRYDSSVFPVGGHDRYSRIEPDELSVVAGPLLRWTGAPLYEIPITTLSLAGRRLPWGGGGWFRLIPPGVFRAGFRRATEQAGGSMFYLHPWEVDPDQPVVEELPPAFRFRHYLNLSRTAARLRRLCQQQDFGRADAWLPPNALS